MPLDRHPIHNVAASVASSAKSWLMAIDQSKAETSVPTPTLVMWLETIIAQSLGEGGVRIEQAARHAVMSQFTEVSEAVRARDEDQDRARLG